MTELNQIYKCSICENIVEMVHHGAGHLVCCGKEMELKKANTQEASVEKHIPVVENVAGGIKVKVGSTDHPMEEKHFIEWIEIVLDQQVLRKYLQPGQAPIAEFSGLDGKFTVRAYCNLHGLWQKE